VRARDEMRVQREGREEEEGSLRKGETTKKERE